MDNSGSINGSLPPLRMVPPSQLDAYIIVARDLLQGVEALSNINTINHRACSLIAAHALECTLKAFLWYKGKKEEIRKPKVQHNLITLWDMSYNEKTLNIPKSPPDWVKILSLGHGPNFYFRYQEGEKKAVVQGGQTPALIPMAIALKEIIEKVENVIKL
ncbi:hypothetical protein [Desulfobacula sp.]|uniref:hypothetical protein n=1 Tax=Desulfobacula sp. TaxID=2593537 RepID=UPI00261CBC49|nr:hypothetical protein [Desulfobacula sp.]